MSIQLTCPCGARFAARDGLAGKQIECVTCGQQLQVPVPQAPVQHAQAPVQYVQPPVQYQNAPVHAPAKAGSTGGAAKWPLIASALGTVGVAVAGGILYFTMNNRIADLNKTVAEQSTTIETKSKGLTEQITTVSKNLSEEKTDKTETEQLAKNVDKLVVDLDKEAKAQRKTKDELDDLVKKTGTLRSEISAMDSKIAKEVAAKSAGFEDRVKELEDARKKIEEEFKNELTKKGGLQDQINQHDTVIKGLDNQIKTEVTKLLPNMKPITDKLGILENLIKTNVTPDPVFKTVSVNTNFRLVVCRLDTRNGATDFLDNSVFPPTRVKISAPPVPFPAESVPGRFDVKIRHDSSGNFGDVVLLDTRSGTVWRSQTGGFGMSWIIMPCQPLPFYSQNNAWRIDIAGPGFVTRPRVFLTDTRSSLVFFNDFSAFILSPL